MEIILFVMIALLGGCFYRAVQEGQEILISPSWQIEYGKWVQTMRGDSALATLSLSEWWGRKNMTYRKDELWNIPETPVYTWHKKSGSCNDTAYLFLDILYLNGQSDSSKASMLTVHNKTNGHSVCVISTPAGYYHASNWDFVRGPFQTLEQVASSIYPDWETAVNRNRMMHEVGRMVR